LAETGNLTPHFGTKLPILLLSGASHRNDFSKNFNSTPLEHKNQNHLKKSLQVWAFKLFQFAQFCSKNNNFWNKAELFFLKGISHKFFSQKFLLEP
jgi:hypothetical protein